MNILNIELTSIEETNLVLNIGEKWLIVYRY